MKTDLLEKTSRIVYTTGLKIKKYSPEILLIAGIAGSVASTVIACKQTLKVKEVLDEKDKNVKIVHDTLDTTSFEVYNQEDANKDLTIIYAQTGIKIAKLYAPAIGLGILSIGAIVSGHKILCKRNAAIAAAYALMDKSFKNYRKNVIETYGQGVDQAMRFGLKAKEVEEKDENGKTIKKEIVEFNNIDENKKEFSIYARFFDASCSGHTKDPEYNLMYLKHQQAYCNELLKSRGHLFLNEVYDILDIPRTKAGQVVGWIYDKDGNNPNGDNYVDFGIYDNNYDPNRRFVNGLEYNILLDFNVDGIIYDLI